MYNTTCVSQSVYLYHKIHVYDLYKCIRVCACMRILCVCMDVSMHNVLFCACMWFIIMCLYVCLFLSVRLSIHMSLPVSDVLDGVIMVTILMEYFEELL